MAGHSAITGNGIVVGDSQLGNPGVPRPGNELNGAQCAIGGCGMSMKIY